MLYPLVIGPAISVTISPRLGIVPLEAKSFNLTVNIHSNDAIHEIQFGHLRRPTHAP